MRPFGLKARGRVGIKIIIRVELEAVERAVACGPGNAGEVAVGFEFEFDSLLFAVWAAARVAFDMDADAAAARRPDAKVDAVGQDFSADRQPPLCSAVLHSYAFREWGEWLVYDLTRITSQASCGWSKPTSNSLPETPPLCKATCANHEEQVGKILEGKQETMQIVMLAFEGRLKAAPYETFFSRSLMRRSCIS